METSPRSPLAIYFHLWALALVALPRQALGSCNSIDCDWQSDVGGSVAMLQRQSSWPRANSTQKALSASAKLGPLKSVDLVLARYDETAVTMKWSDEFRNLETPGQIRRRLIFNAGGGDLELSVKAEDAMTTEVFSVMNHGTESYQFLHYIVHYYDMLPDMVIFSQASPLDNSPQMAELIQIPSKYSEVQPLSQMTSCWFAGKFLCPEKLTGEIACQNDCLISTYPMDYNFEAQHQACENGTSYIEAFFQACINPKFKGKHKDTWHAFINELKLDIDLPAPLYKSLFGVFAATREAIRSRPLAVWKALYEWQGNEQDQRFVSEYLEEGPSSWCKTGQRPDTAGRVKGFFLELAWLALLGYKPPQAIANCWSLLPRQ